MAREIHDTLAQSLAGILAQLQAAEQTLTGGSPERRQVTAAIALAREGLTEARREDGERVGCIVPDGEDFLAFDALGRAQGVRLPFPAPDALRPAEG